MCPPLFAYLWAAQGLGEGKGREQNAKWPAFLLAEEAGGKPPKESKGFTSNNIFWIILCLNITFCMKFFSPHACIYKKNSLRAKQNWHVPVALGSWCILRGRKTTYDERWAYLTFLESCGIGTPEGCIYLSQRWMQLIKGALLVHPILYWVSPNLLLPSSVSVKHTVPVSGKTAGIPSHSLSAYYSPHMPIPTLHTHGISNLTSSQKPSWTVSYHVEHCSIYYPKNWMYCFIIHCFIL